MRIKKMTASFGRLQNATLEPGPGLTIIQAPNEGGKSTWAAFLRAMLYGIPTRERDRQGYIAEKNRYQPWNGAAMEGVLELSWRGRDVIIRRGPRGSAPFAAFEAVDAVTGEAVPGLTGENCGEVLLGIPREVYERSAFVGQGGCRVDGAPALEARIAALASSGEEDVSYTKVERRLKDWLNRRRHNKTGLIPRMEEELEQISATQERQAGALRQAGEARMALEQLERERGALVRALEAHRLAANRAAEEKYREAQTALRAAEEEEAGLRRETALLPPAQQLREAQGDLSYLNTVNANLRLAARQSEEAAARAEEAQAAAEDPLFPGLTADEAWRRAGADAERWRRQKKTGGRLALSAACLIAAVCLLFLGLFGPPEVRMVSFLAVAAAAAGAVLLVRTLSLRRRQAAERSALAARYGADNPDGILERANAYRARQTAAAEAAQRAEAVRTAMEQLTTQREELTASLLALVRSFAPQVTDLFGVSAALSRALSLEEKYTAAAVRLEGARKLADSLPRPDDAYLTAGEARTAAGEPAELTARLEAVEGEMARLRGELARAEGEWNTLGDPDALHARAEELEEALTVRRAEYDALDIALEELAAAHGQLQARFSPALNARAGALMSALTGGKYGGVTLNRDFEALAAEAGAVLPRRALSLSQGTADQLYLAVRLAVCDLVLPPEEPAPLVLDDVLAAFDDARTALALEVLAGMGEQRQILLFTCHSRERAWAAGRGDAAVLPITTLSDFM